MRLDGYVRVSDTAGRSGETFISPDDQKDKIERWAIGHSHEIAHWETDLDATGTKLSRPGFDRILERIRRKETDGVVVAYLSRLSRAGVGDALKLIDEITNEHGAVLGCYSPQIDTADPVMGRFVLTIFLALNAMESARIGANWADARTRAIKRGVHSAVAPFGYLRREDGRLEPDPATGPIVTEIYQRRAAGQSWQVIAKWLTDIGSTTATGNTWSVTKLRQLTDNRVYLGQLNDKGLGIRHEDTHPPLTDPVTWEQTVHHRGTRFGDTPRDDALLRGLARCAGCRYTMGAITLRGGVHYRCTRDLTSHDCPAPAQIKAEGPRRPGLHRYVIDQVIARAPEYEAIAYDPASTVEDVHAAVQAARAREIAHATDLELEEALGRDAWMARGEALRIAREQAEETERELLRTEAGRMVKPMRLLSDDLRNVSIDRQREALGTVVQSVFVRRSSDALHTTKHGLTGTNGALGRVHIVWADEPQVDVPRQGRRGYTIRPFLFPDPDGPGDVGEAVA